MNWSQPITKEKLLLVEGWDEMRAFDILALSMDVTLEIRDAGGDGNWPRALRTIAKASGFTSVRSLGLVTDADADPVGKFATIVSCLADAGLPQPSAPMVTSTGFPQVTVLISPGGGRTGQLEDFFLDSLASHPVEPCLDSFEQCLLGAGTTIPTRHSKMRLQIHMAVGTRGPYKHIGDACKANHFDFSHHAFAPMRSLINAL